MLFRRLRRPAAISATLLCAACSGVYYSALEKVGIEKRELLVDRVEAAREAHGKAQEQFTDAFEQFKAVVGYDGGDLEAMYKTLSREYEASRSRAEDVRARIAAVKDVAGALFREWEGEIEEYSDARLQRESRRQLKQTRVRYERLVNAMDRAATSMDPVLAAFHDHTLFLKHNLNARALGSLAGTVEEFQVEVSRLISQMQGAINEASQFIATLEPEPQR